MKFGVLLTEDVPRGGRIIGLPKSLSSYLKKIAGDEQAPEGFQKHRSYKGLLKRHSFDKLVELYDLRSEDVRTTYVRGMPSPDKPSGESFLYTAPYILFIGQRKDRASEMYVTPYPDISIVNRAMDDQWFARAFEKIKKAILKTYG